MLGTDKIVGYLGQAFGDGKNFALVLSATKLPDAHAVLDRIGGWCGEWSRGEGAWYQTREGGTRGWFFPEIFHSFTDGAPPTLFVRVEQVGKR